MSRQLVAQACFFYVAKTSFDDRTMAAHPVGAWGNPQIGEAVSLIDFDYA